MDFTKILAIRTVSQLRTDIFSCYFLLQISHGSLYGVSEQSTNIGLLRSVRSTTASVIQIPTNPIIKKQEQISVRSCDTVLIARILVKSS